ncbi:MAG: hypothetical protein QXT45_07660 [Candidatus Bilamarchaeaceae archaeon]
MLIRPFRLDIVPNVTVETSGLGNVVQSSSEPPDYTIVRQITSSYLPPSQLPVGRMLYAPYPEMVGLVAIVTVYNNTTSTRTVSLRINTTREDGTTIITNSDCATTLWIANNNITTNYNVGANFYATRGYTMICPVGGYLRIKLWCANAALPITQLAIISFPVVRNLDLNGCVIWGLFSMDNHVNGTDRANVLYYANLSSNAGNYTAFSATEVRALPCYYFNYPLYTMAISSSINLPFGLQTFAVAHSTELIIGTNRASIVGYIAHVPTLPL